MFNEQEETQREHLQGQHSPHSKYSSNHPSARGSATTIDVPLFLQPQPFDLETAPPLPRMPPPPQTTNGLVRSPSPSEGQAPAPPKIPQEHYESPVERLPTKQPHYDPRSSFGVGHYWDDSQSPLESSGSRKRPRFDPQQSLNLQGSIDVWDNRELRPSIPTPRFTSFNVKTALPNSLRDSSHESISVQQPTILPARSVDNEVSGLCTAGTAVFPHGAV